MATLIMSELKTIYNKNLLSKLSALIIKKSVSDLRTKMNPDAIGGTALLGITKPVIKAHGSSNSTAICNAICQAVKVAGSDISGRLESNIARLKFDEVS
jgi:glycerol-3-phosphate acyltransferase PlsX